MRDPQTHAPGWRGVRPELRRVWKLSWPVMASGLVQLLLPMVDTVLIARVSPGALAALGVAAPVYVLATMLLYGAGLALKVVVTHRHGAGRTDEVGKATDVALAATVALAGAAAVLVLALSAPLVRALAPGLDVVADAAAYLRISAASLPLLAVGVTLLAAFAGAGRTRVMLGYALLLAAVNVGAGVALVFGAGLGVRGAALATVAACATASAFAAAYGRARLRHLVPFGRWRLAAGEWRAHGAVLWRLGWPEVVLLCVGFASPVLLVRILGAGGEIAVAGYRVLDNLFMPLFTVAAAYHAGVVVLAGQCLGAGDAGRVQAVRRAGLLLASVTVALSATPLALAPRAVVAAIAPDAAVIAAAAAGVRPMALALLLAGWAAVLAGALRAGGDVRYVMTVELAGEYGFVLPLTWVLAQHAGLGLRGLGLAWVAGWGAILLLQARRLRGPAPVPPVVARGPATALTGREPRRPLAGQ